MDQKEILAAESNEMATSLLHDSSFVLAVAFVVLLFLIVKPIGRILIAALDKRSNNIEQELEEARKLREEAQELLSSYQRDQEQAMSKAEEIIANAEENAKSMIEYAQKELEDALNKRIELSMKKIENMEANVLKEVWQESIDNAISTVIDSFEGQKNASLSSQLRNHSIENIQKLG